VVHRAVDVVLDFVPAGGCVQAVPELPSDVWGFDDVDVHGTDEVPAHQDLRSARPVKAGELVGAVQGAEVWDADSGGLDGALHLDLVTEELGGAGMQPVDAELLA